MYHEHDFWTHSTPLLEPDVIKDINKTIGERYYKVENKTYGVCRVTGKLINKKRLELVPHATLSIEAKNMQK